MNLKKCKIGNLAGGKGQLRLIWSDITRICSSIAGYTDRIFKCQEVDDLVSVRKRS
jgi:hypothetical protein